MRSSSSTPDLVNKQPARRASDRSGSRPHKAQMLGGPKKVDCVLRPSRCKYDLLLCRIVPGMNSIHSTPHRAFHGTLPAF